MVLDLKLDLVMTTAQCATDGQSSCNKIEKLIGKVIAVRPFSRKESEGLCVILTFLVKLGRFVIGEPLCDLETPS